MAVAVRLDPPYSYSRDSKAVTEYHKADDFSFGEHEVVIYRDGQKVASYHPNVVTSVRLSKRPFSSHKVTFVRRIRRAKGAA